MIRRRARGERTLGLTIYQVDAFTDKAFAVDPAAVGLLPAARSGVVKVRVAGDRVYLGGPVEESPKLPFRAGRNHFWE